MEQRKFEIQDLTATNPGFNQSIGGSTIASILGLNPWEGRYEAWLRLTGKVSPKVENPAMARGHRFEPIIADIYQAAHPEFMVSNINPDTQAFWFVRDREYPFITGQPDRMLLDSATANISKGLEIKTASTMALNKWGDDGTDQIPQNYFLQAMQYCGLMGGIDWNLIVMFFRPRDNGAEVPCETREYTIPFDGELFEMMREQAAAFWNNHVVPDIPPEVDNVGDTFAEYLRATYPRNIKPVEKATLQEEEVIERYFEAKKVVDAATAELDRVKGELQLLIGDRDGLVANGIGKISWKKSNDSNVIDWKGVVEDLGVEVSEDILAKRTSVRAGTRLFRATPAKK